MDNRRGRYDSYVLFLLVRLTQAARDGVGIPPGTFFVIILQTAIYMRFIPVPWNSPDDVCISIERGWRQGEWSRFFLAGFEHVDGMHLYYNMLSFLVKGRTLERIFGTFTFVFLLVWYTILSNALYLFLNHLVVLIFGSEEYRYHCGIGFSGVIFALKVLTTHFWHHADRRQIMMDFGGIPTKWLVWFELLLIQLIEPDASFIGHLAGILVGLVDCMLMEPL